MILVIILPPLPLPVRYHYGSLLVIFIITIQRYPDIWGGTIMTRMTRYDTDDKL